MKKAECRMESKSRNPGIPEFTPHSALRSHLIPRLFFRVNFTETKNSEVWVFAKLVISGVDSELVSRISVFRKFEIYSEFGLREILFIRSGVIVGLYYYYYIFGVPGYGEVLVHGQDHYRFTDNSHVTGKTGIPEVPSCWNL